MYISYREGGTLCHFVLGGIDALEVFFNDEEFGEFSLIASDYGRSEVIENVHKNSHILLPFKVIDWKKLRYYNAFVTTGI